MINSIINHNIMESRCHRIPLEASHIKKGMYIIMKTRPCKIVDVTTSKTGKHGHMKVSMTGIDVINSTKQMMNIPGHNNVTQFELLKEECIVINFEDDILEYLDSNNNINNIKIDDNCDIIKKFRELYDSNKEYIVTIITAPIEKTTELYIDEQTIESFKEN